MSPPLNQLTMGNNLLSNPHTSGLWDFHRGEYTSHTSDKEAHRQEGNIHNNTGTFGLMTVNQELLQFQA